MMYNNSRAYLKQSHNAIFAWISLRPEILGGPGNHETMHCGIHPNMLYMYVAKQLS